MGNTFDLEKIEKDFVVDIMNCDKNKDYITAYIHNKNGSRNMSFSITTSPNYLFYYGDVGEFMFHRFDQGKMLNFFDANPNYYYWREKLEAGKAGEFNLHELSKSLLENVIDTLELSEEEFSEEDIENVNTDKMRRLLDNLPDERFEVSDLYKADFIDLFEDISEFYCEEYYLGNIIDSWEKLFGDAEGIKYESYTDRFILCCKNLSKYSSIILEKADEYLEGKK